MACQAMHFWTFTGLVGAFIDLAIAYFLLCASSIAFFAVKFLGFFGLSLPCPCDGLFVNPNSNYCLHRLLVDFPTKKASSVQLAVRSKFPFDSVLAKDQNLDLSLKLVEDRNIYGNGFVELEGEASCSSISDSKRSENVVGRELVPLNENGVEFGVASWPGRKLDMKGKGITNHRQKIGIRRRRKSCFDYGKFSSVSYYDRLGVPQSPSSINEEHNEMIGGRSDPVDFGIEAKCFLDAEEAPTVMIMGDKGFHDVDLNQYIDDYKPKETNEELRSDAPGDLADGDEMNNIKVLEQALEEEHTSRAALYLELEKERNAAATAADEALAMILRLQEEKASIEMQARQYQRIIEEKTAYDAEEMDILKEILLRREREKHFLEKEVEAYRQMANSGSEQLDGNVQFMVDNQSREQASSLDPTEDTDLMLHELSKSIEKKEMVKTRSSNLEVTSIGIQKCSLVPLEIREWDEDENSSNQLDNENHFSSKCIDDGSQELQEKEMITVDCQLARPKEGKKLETYLQSYKPSSSQEHNFPEKTIPIVGEEQEKNGSASICEGATKNGKSQNESGIYIQNDDQDLGKHGKDVTLASKVPCNIMFDKELHVHDVHVIDDNSKIYNEVSGKKSKLLSDTDTSKVISGDIPHEASEIQKIENKKDSSSTSRLDIVTDINRSSSDMAIGLPPSGSRGRSLFSDMRRSSMSALDTERIKIDTEIEWLREKLRTVQEGREKLNLSMDQEKEKLQLQLLEDIASQLREIRQLTEPGKAMRQVSLPPLSSKAMSKKRRCRSAYSNNSS